MYSLLRSQSPHLDEESFVVKTDLHLKKSCSWSTVSALFVSVVCNFFLGYYVWHTRAHIDQSLPSASIAEDINGIVSLGVVIQHSETCP